ncbi:MAG: 23S rRNA (adenine(2030)-N(6))-methyltransferase RlmJ [Alphaproteobacteria bacterium]|nr:23S rRNA (adenine(2030)-N(6))-methyltransferase RlmJ [Alphaproteobacteria bacterium]
MNYHHIYHAGNFADVFKHIILVFCLEKFHQKPAPFFVLDTHAGIGKYDLMDERALRTSEASTGIQRIFQQKNLPESYLKILQKLNPDSFPSLRAKTSLAKQSTLPDELLHCASNEEESVEPRFRFYAGSPLIIKHFIRPQDRAIFAELNREDFFSLRRHFAGNQKFTLLNCDGFSLLKSKLPPIERRGLIIIDPAFEKDQSKISTDYEKIISGLQEAQKRFAHGVYLVWYPIIQGEEKFLENFYQKISGLKFEKKMRVVCEQKIKTNKKMNTCGMLILNAPWQLEERLNGYFSSFFSSCIINVISSPLSKSIN